MIDAHRGGLTDESLAVAVETLTRIDTDLAAIVERFGPPPLWARPPGFPTLTFIILEQQVSLASARATYERLQAATRGLTPERFLGLDDAELLRIGFSRQKARYVRGLSRSVLDGSLDLDLVAAGDVATARHRLIELPGIGPWTADIYLLLALGRPDVWPIGDLALVSAVCEVKGLPARPTAEAMVELAEPWRPWRSVAARLFWHDYLSRRGQRDAGPDLLEG